MSIHPNIYRLMLSVLVLLSIDEALAQVTSGPQQYVFERQWPPLSQPWNFGNRRYIALAPDASLWAINQTGVLQHFKADGSIIGQLGQAGQFGDAGIAVTQDGGLWIANYNGKVVHLDGTGGVDKVLTNASVASNGAAGIAMADDKRFWVTQPALGLILHFNEQGQLLDHGKGICAELSLYGAASSFDTTPSAAGDRWRWVYSDAAGSQVLRHIDIDGNILFEIGRNIAGSPGQTAVAADGSLWIAANGDYGSPTHLRHVSAQGALLGHIDNLVPDEVWKLKIALDGSLWIVHSGKLLHLNNQGDFLNEIDVKLTTGSLYIGDIALAADNSVWVATQESQSKLLHYSSDGTLLKQIDHYGQTQFGFSISLINMPDHSLWLGDDGNHRLLHLTSLGDYLAQIDLQTIAGGSISYLSKLGLANDGSLLVYGSNTGQDSVLRFMADGQFIESIAGNGYESCASSAPGSFARPMGIALAKDGSLWVADTDNNRIQHFSATGQFIKVVGAEGNASGQFQLPENIALAKDGSIWVADTGNHRLQHLTVEGVYLGQVGSQGSAPGQFQSPSGIAIADDGSLWVMDLGNRRLQHLAANGAFIAQFGRYFTDAQVENNFAPADITIISDGSLWVTNSNHSVFTHLSADGSLIAQSDHVESDPFLMRPEAYKAVDGSFWTRTKWEEYVNSGGIAGGVKETVRLQHFTANGALTTESTFERVRSALFTNHDFDIHFTVEPDGSLWLIDQSNPLGLIQHVSTDGKLLEQLGLNAGTGSGQFNGIGGIASDGKGAIWVVDSGNKRIQKFVQHAAPSSSAEYDDLQQRLYLHDVTVGMGLSHYDAVLQLQNDRFNLITAELTSQRLLAPANFDPTSGQLTVPFAQAYGTHYAATFNHLGHYGFQLNTETRESPYPLAQSQLHNDELLILPDLVIDQGKNHYAVTLQLKIDRLIVSASSLSDQRRFTPANFDTLSGKVTIPSTDYSNWNKKYQGTLKHLGNLEFAIDNGGS